MPKFSKGVSGNPQGRPRGRSDRRNALRQHLESHAPELVEKLIAVALAGDVAALKLCLDRCLPVLKPVDSPLAIGARAGSLSERGEAVLQDCLAGRITPDESTSLLAGLAALARIKESAEFEQRLAALEARLNTRHHEAEPPTPARKT